MPRNAVGRLSDGHVRAVEAGLSRRATARRFEVGVSFVIKLVQRRRRNGTVQPDRYDGWKRLALATHAERVRAQLAAEPDFTIAGLRARLAAEGILASPAAISRFLAADGLTREKDPACAERARPDVAAARAASRLWQPS